ncbi:MAG TPA: hypothetical protein VHC69_04840 [Polyangiaceae bacterium]|nr:hypothetical protein [Polyangiaceae bacterium]
MLAFVIGASVAPEAAAQDRRPSEDELFGGKPETPAPQGSATPPNAAPAPPGQGAPSAAPEPGSEAKPPAGPSATPGGAAAPPSTNPAAASEEKAPAAPNSAPADSRDEAVLGGHETPMFTEEAAPSDPLRIGGQIYLRAQSTALRGQSPSFWSYSAPSLTDVYLDARPNDRVRGFVLGRMTYDPTLPSSGELQATPVQGFGGTSGSAPLSSLFGQQTNVPHVVLDQLWLRFDIAHTVFVTAGKQHVRWGTGHFWSPTDFLHLNFRNPLDVFDARTGTTMVKLHVPIESKAWNFYAYALSENVDATQSIGRIGGAARAEFVLDASEFGVGALVRRDEDPKIAADVSFGIGDFDVYGEMALRNSSEIDRVQYVPSASLPATPGMDATSDQQLAYVQALADRAYHVYQFHDYRPQVVGGVSYSRKYNDNDMFTVGAEYFYNGLGYNNDTDAYLGLVLPRTVPLSQPATFFYLGQHYGALYVTFPSPFKLDLHTFTLSTLGNLSDQSFITRLDYSLVLLTHLRFEAFASARYGNQYGEFRFGLKGVPGTPIPATPPAIMDLGVALRLAI